MKVFLTHSYFYRFDKKQWDNKTPYPPLATISAAALLKNKNLSTEFHDVGLDISTDICKEKILNSGAEIVVIYDDGFNYLTKMCLTNMRNACLDLISAAKSIHAKVIVSSSDSTDHYQLYHDQGADIVIHGEGEYALLECCESVEKKEPINKIDGISFFDKGEIIKNPARGRLKEIDELPTADWELIDIPAYKEIWEKSKFPFTLNISTTRGCPFKCNWCAKPIYGNRYNSRSPERVVDEITYLYHTYGVDHFWVTDDIFGLKPGWVTRFNELIQEKKLSIKYKIQSRADLLLKDKTIDELVASGLDEVWIGAESGSQKILDAMDKGITLEQINESTRLLQQKGAKVAYFLQFGYLDENKDDIQSTINMVKNNKPDDIGISVSYPLPGTPFYDKVKAQMGSKKNWEDSDDLDLMFEGTYSSNYYRVLQRYVHHMYRLRQGIRKLFQPKAAISWRYTLLIPYNFVASFTSKIKLR